MSDWEPAPLPMVGATAGGWEPAPVPMVPNPIGAPMMPSISTAPAIGPGPRTSQMPDQPMPPMPWGDVLRSGAANFFPSVGRAAESIYDAFRHPLDTGQNLVKLGVGALENLPQPRGTEANRAELAVRFPETAAARAEARATADAVGQHLTNRYGGLENFKATLATDPAGVMLDASTLSPMAGATLPGKAGAVASTVGKIVDPLTIAGNVGVRLPAKAADIAGSNALGFNTGIGARSLRDIGSAGRELGSGLELNNGFIPKTGDVARNATAVVDNMNHGAPVENVVTSAKGALSTARKDASTAYRAGMKEVGKIEEPIPFGPIEDAVNSANDVKNFGGVQLDPSAAATKAQIADTVNAWKALDQEHPIFKDATEALTPENYHTPVGIDALKQLIGDIRSSTLPGTASRAVAERVYNALGTEIRKAAPDYAEVMAKYGSSAGNLKEASRVFSLGERATGQSAAQKLLGATRDQVPNNNGGKAAILDRLAEHDSTLPYQIAGQAAQSVLPRGLVARGGLMAHMLGGGAAALLAHPLTSIPAAIGMAAFSPRIVGNAVYYGGRMIGSVEDVAKAMKINPDTLRAMERGGYQAGQNNALQGNPYVGAR